MLYTPIRTENEPRGGWSEDEMATAISTDSAEILAQYKALRVECQAAVDAYTAVYDDSARAVAAGTTFGSRFVGWEEIDARKAARAAAQAQFQAYVRQPHVERALRAAIAAGISLSV